MWPFNKHSSTFLSNATGNLLSSILAKALILAALFVSARVLGPAQYGVWAMCSLIIYWSVFINLGTHAIMLQEIAAHPGDTDRHYAEGVRNKTLTLTLLLIGISIAALYAILLTSAGARSPGVRLNVHGVAAIIVLLQLFLYLLSYWSGMHLFRAVSALRSLYAGITCACILVMVFSWGIQALIWGTLCGYLYAIVSVFLRYPFKVRLEIDIAFFKWILKAGFPFLCIGIARVSLHTMDRAFVYTHMGMRAMGWYSLAYAVSDLLLIISFAVTQVLYAKMVTEYRAKKNAEQVQQLFFSSIDLCFSGMTLLFVWVWYFAPILLPRLLPQYVEGLLPSILLSQAAIFLSLTVLCGNFLLAIGHPRRYLAVLILGCLLKVALVESVLRHGGGLTEVAIVNLAVYAILFLAAWHLCGMNKGSVQGRLRTHVLFPFGLCLATAGLYLLDYLPCCIAVTKICCMILFSSVLLWRVRAGLKKVNLKANESYAYETCTDT
ncbi:MAG: oligosaccharide flippase family protein [Candidatus Omnitrophota bacterium]